jgi:hypothetical protein
LFSSANSGSHNITIAKISTNGILMLRLCVFIMELEVALWQRRFKIPLAVEYPGEICKEINAINLMIFLILNKKKDCS